MIYAHLCRYTRALALTVSVCNVNRLHCINYEIGILKLADGYRLTHHTTGNDYDYFCAFTKKSVLPAQVG